MECGSRRTAGVCGTQHTVRCGAFAPWITTWMSGDVDPLSSLVEGRGVASSCDDCRAWCLPPGIGRRLGLGDTPLPSTGCRTGYRPPSSAAKRGHITLGIAGPTRGIVSSSKRPAASLASDINWKEGSNSPDIRDDPWCIPVLCARAPLGSSTPPLVRPCAAKPERLDVSAAAVAVEGRSVVPPRRARTAWRRPGLVPALMEASSAVGTPPARRHCRGVDADDDVSRETHY